jgi:prophage regulatory protein
MDDEFERDHAWILDDRNRLPALAAFMRWKELKSLVVYCTSRIYVLEAAGLFPRRYHLGPGRAVWMRSEIMEWMQARLDERPPNGMPQANVEHGDRFIARRELSALVPYTVRHLSTLECEGKFPRRVRLGPKRVAWLEREVIQWLRRKRQP